MKHANTPASNWSLGILVAASLAALASTAISSTNTNPSFVFSAFLSSAGSVQNIAGSYASNMPPNNLFSSANPYVAIVSSDEKGKLLAQGTISGVTNTNGLEAPLDAKGAMKTQKGMSVASFKASEKNIFYNGLPAKATGSTALELVETNAQVLKAQGGGQEGTGKTADKGRGTYAYGKKGATNEEFLNAPTNNTAGGEPWECSFQVYRNEFGHYFATNATLLYYNYDTNTGSVAPTYTRYPSEWVKFSEKDGSYSVNFYKPTSGDLNAKWSVKKLVPVPTSAPKGAISYKFLGQGGTTEVTNFTRYLIQTNTVTVGIVDENLPPGVQ